MKAKTSTLVFSIVIASLFVASLVAYVERSIISTYEENAPFLIVGEHLRNQSTKAHLWFEEAMAGDVSINVERDVYTLLENSIATMQTVREGGVADVGTFNKLENTQIEVLLESATVDATSLLQSAKKRWANKVHTDAGTSSAGEEAGGKMDQEFDAAYEALQGRYQRIIDVVSEKSEAKSSSLNVVSWASIGIVVLVLMALAYFISRILRGNDALVLDNAARIQEESKRVSTLTTFLEAVSTNEFNIQLDATNELDKRLLGIRDTLKTSNELEAKRNWATRGLAEIGALLRNQNQSAEELYNSVIRFVVKYTSSNQGSLFLLNDEEKQDPYIQLAACYAWDKRKYLEKKIQLDEGLVGQCMQEQETIYLTNLPTDYIRITSGLGHALPKALALVPLKVNDEILGVLEIASFQKFEPYQLEFLEKLAETIASTISTVRTNHRTKELLLVSQQQTEEMRAQEEEMKQNMEELAATQEEMARKEREYILRIEELEKQLSGQMRAA